MMRPRKLGCVEPALGARVTQCLDAGLRLVPPLEAHTVRCLACAVELRRWGRRQDAGGFADPQVTTRRLERFRERIRSLDEAARAKSDEDL